MSSLKSFRSSQHQVSSRYPHLTASGIHSRIVVQICIVLTSPAHNAVVVILETVPFVDRYPGYITVSYW